MRQMSRVALKNGCSRQRRKINAIRKDQGKSCGGSKRQKVYVRGKKARDCGGSTAQKKENKQ